MARRIIYLCGIAVLALSAIAALPLLFAIGYAFFVPDPTGSPDARGMLFASGLMGLMVVSLVAIVAAIAVAFSRPKKATQSS